MEPKKYLTSGEASEILGISRGTVSKKFDDGVLEGKKNPITGKRLISSESLKDFMKRYDFEVSDEVSDIVTSQVQKKLLVVTSDERLLSVVKKSIGDYKQIEMETAAYGGEALIKCAQEPIDLLIIDAELPDIAGENVVRSLKSMNLHKGLKLLYYVKDDVGERYDTSCTDDYIEGKSLDGEVLKNKIFSLLDIHPDVNATDQLFSHKRRWSRISANLPADIYIYDPANPEQSESGSAIILNISYGGALISKIRLSKKIFFGSDFRIGLRVGKSPSEIWEVLSKVVRLKSNEQFEVGVEFIDISDEDQKNILKLPFNEE